MFPKITFSPDKFGYYQAGDLKTYSKIEALEWAKRTNSGCTWIFNDSVYGQIDWSKEPDLSLWELYKLRCHQIRDSYDYVVLWYSGGSDSQNMLDAWIESGAKIDEVASVWSNDGSKSERSAFDAEVKFVVFPKIKNLDIKFRLIDQSQMILDYINKSKKNHWEYEINQNLSPNNGVRGLLREQVEDWSRLIASGVRMCFVWGSDKPMMSNDGNIYFSDVVDNCVSPYVQRNYYNGWYDELFYWTPDFPDLVVKQAHVVKRFINRPAAPDSFFQKQPHKYGYSPHKKMWLSDWGIKQLLYPTWNPRTFCAGKSPNTVLSRIDS